MFDLDSSLHQQLSQYSDHRQTLVFPEPEDPRVIEAASRLVNYARIILVGDLKEVTALMDYGACKLACSRDRFFSRAVVVDPADEDLVRAELSARSGTIGPGSPTKRRSGQWDSGWSTDDRACCPRPRKER